MQLSKTRAPGLPAHISSTVGFIFTPRFPPLAACNWFRPGDKETEEYITIIKVTYINTEFAPSSVEVPQTFHETLLITLHDLTNKINPSMLGVF
jgi:hypothetical protein